MLVPVPVLLLVLLLVRCVVTTDQLVSVDGGWPGAMGSSIPHHISPLSLSLIMSHHPPRCIPFLTPPPLSPHPLAPASPSLVHRTVQSILYRVSATRAPHPWLRSVVVG
jgi:hypothetical protein